MRTLPLLAFTASGYNYYGAAVPMPLWNPPFHQRSTQRPTQPSTQRHSTQLQTFWTLPRPPAPVTTTTAIAKSTSAKRLQRPWTWWTSPPQRKRTPVRRRSKYSRHNKHSRRHSKSRPIRVYVELYQHGSCTGCPKSTEVPFPLHLTVIYGEKQCAKCAFWVKSSLL